MSQKSLDESMQASPAHSDATTLVLGDHLEPRDICEDTSPLRKPEDSGPTTPPPSRPFSTPDLPLSQLVHMYQTPPGPKRKLRGYMLGDSPLTDLRKRLAMKRIRGQDVDMTSASSHMPKSQDDEPESKDNEITEGTDPKRRKTSEREKQQSDSSAGKQDVVNQ